MPHGATSQKSEIGLSRQLQAAFLVCNPLFQQLQLFLLFVQSCLKILERESRHLRRIPFPRVHHRIQSRQIGIFIFPVTGKNIFQLFLRQQGQFKIFPVARRQEQGDRHKMFLYKHFINLPLFGGGRMVQEFSFLIHIQRIPFGVAQL